MVFFLHNIQPTVNEVRSNLQADTIYAVVTFHPEMLRLPFLQDGPNLMVDDRDFFNRQSNCDLLISGSDGVDLLCKTGPELPATVDPVFNVKFSEATSGA